MKEELSKNFGSERRDLERPLLQHSRFISVRDSRCPLSKCVSRDFIDSILLPPNPPLETAGSRYTRRRLHRILNGPADLFLRNPDPGRIRLAMHMSLVSIYHT